MIQRLLDVNDFNYLLVFSRNFRSVIPWPQGQRNERLTTIRSRASQLYKSFKPPVNPLRSFSAQIYLNSSTSYGSPSALGPVGPAPQNNLHGPSPLTTWGCMDAPSLRGLSRSPRMAR